MVGRARSGLDDRIVLDVRKFELDLFGRRGHPVWALDRSGIGCESCASAFEGLVGLDEHAGEDRDHLDGQTRQEVSTGGNGK